MTLSHRSEHRQENKSTVVLRAFIIAFVNPYLSTVAFSPFLFLVKSTYLGLLQ